MDKKPLSFAEIVTIVGLFWGVLAGLCPMNWLLKLILLLIPAIAVVCAAVNLRWTIGLSKKVKTIIAIAIGLFLIAICSYPVYDQWQKDHAPSVQERKIEMEKNIYLTEAAIGAWPRTASVNDYYHLSGKSLIDVFVEAKNDYRITPFVINDNQFPLYNPRIAILLPREIEVKSFKGYWRRASDVPAYQVWVTEFDLVLRGEARGVDDWLLLKFPRSGVYEVKYSIKGIIQGIAINTEGSFNLSLIKE
jgi:hypothetical protein